MASLLSADNLKELFEKCLRELKKEPIEVDTLYTFSGLFDVLLDATGKHEWSAVRPFMALLANEISESNRIMISIYGLIDESRRKEEEKSLRETVNDVASIINEIEEEFCGKKTPNASKLIEYIGRFDKHYLELIRRRMTLSQILQTLRPIPPPPE